MLGFAVAGGASAIALSDSAAGSQRAPRVGVESIGCTETSAAGQRPSGRCTYGLSDGRRFQCPLAFSHRRQTPRSLERAKACRALTPIRIRPGWRRVFAHLDAVRDCLSRHGINTRGGPALDIGDPSKTPIGELELTSVRTPALIAFYTGANVARRAEPRVVRTAEQSGGRVERRGSVLVFWITPPPAKLSAATDACAFS